MSENSVDLIITGKALFTIVKDRLYMMVCGVEVDDTIRDITFKLFHYIFDVTDHYFIPLSTLFLSRTHANNYLFKKKPMKLIVLMLMCSFW